MKNKFLLFFEFEKKIKKINNINNLKKFYLNFIKKYNKLNAKYNFSNVPNAKYIIQQIENNFFLKNKNLWLIPFGIKNNINTEKYITDFGLKNKKHYSGNNARVVEKIIKNGGLIFSKTNTAEFAFNHIQKKKRKNPLNPKFIAGTSSTGSAIAVACGALPITIGTQTAGSILRPASFCGVYGFKPTYGSIDRTGVLKTSDLFDTVGLLGSDIFGIKKTFNCLLEESKDYPWTKKYQTKKKKKITIGFFDDTLNVYKNYDINLKKDYNSLIKKISSKFKIKNITCCDLLNDLHLLHEKIYYKSIDKYLKIFSKKQEFSEELLSVIKFSKKISVKEFINLWKKCMYLRKKIDENLKEFDIIIIPTTGTSAPKLNEKEIHDSCLIWTLMGYPTISIPCFYNAREKMPIGLQIIAKRYDDFFLLDFSKKILPLLTRTTTSFQNK
jgi:Asp-tRNA(Asn)/Glu-tRNA(Gln) amidotransferase A subunit family amidase